MPSKSKRNRRVISQRAISQNRTEVASPIAPSADNTAPITRIQSRESYCLIRSDIERLRIGACYLC